MEDSFLDGRSGLTSFDLPARQPAALRLRTLSLDPVRIEAVPFARWGWTPFSSPRYRFDSAAGVARVRYAGTSPVGAARERYRDTGLVIPMHHANHYVVQLHGRLSLLDLRQDRTLDLLGLDDQISTSRAPDVWRACHQLTDLVLEWWGHSIDGIMYRSRTTPQRSANLAFFEHAPLTGRSQVLRRSRRFLDELVVSSGFTVRF